MRVESVEKIEMTPKDAFGLWLLWPSSSILLNLLWLPVGFTILLLWMLILLGAVLSEWVASAGDEP